MSLQVHLAHDAREARALISSPLFRVAAVRPLRKPVNDSGIQGLRLVGVLERGLPVLMTTFVGMRNKPLTGRRQDWKDTFGISEDFVQRVGKMLQPGDSAVFVLARTINPDLVADAFKGYGGTVLRTTLSKQQRAKVEATLRSR
jgi:uncharacterized membrane protein